MRFHVYSTAPKTHTFGFQPKALLKSGIAAELDFAARAQHALPGQAVGAAQDFCDLASVSRKTSGLGNRAVGRNLAPGNLPNPRANTGLRRKLLTGRQA